MFSFGYIAAKYKNSTYIKTNKEINESRNFHVGNGQMNWTKCFKEVTFTEYKLTSDIN